jgi:putative IMPACT (imprinted ancient) family translation regulator
VFRANDDGEPSNSAGKPILGQIESFDLTNVLIVVVRYFGGTKLGVGGLIDAYRTGARTAIENGVIIEKQVMSRYRVNFPYEAMSPVMSLLKQHDIGFTNQEFDNSCQLETEIRAFFADGFTEALEKIPHVSFDFLGEK